MATGRAANPRNWKKLPKLFSQRWLTIAHELIKLVGITTGQIIDKNYFQSGPRSLKITKDMLTSHTIREGQGTKHKAEGENLLQDVDKRLPFWLRGLPAQTSLLGGSLTSSRPEGRNLWARLHWSWDEVASCFYWHFFSNIKFFDPDLNQWTLLPLYSTVPLLNTTSARSYFCLRCRPTVVP